MKVLRLTVQLKEYTMFCVKETYFAENEQFENLNTNKIKDFYF